MAIIFIVRIPGIRNFSIYLPSSWQLSEDFLHWYRRTVRSQLFVEIENGNDKAALELATPRRLKRAKGEWGETALRAAISAERYELACEFIRRGGARPNDGTLSAAAMHGDISVIQALLAAGKNPDEPFPELELGTTTPLMWATNRRHPEAMKVLLKAGANVNAACYSKYTALLHACTGTPEDIQMVEVLLPYKPNIQAENFQGRSPLREAIELYRVGKPETFFLLRSHYPELDLDAALASEPPKLE